MAQKYVPSPFSILPSEQKLTCRFGRRMVDSLLEQTSMAAPLIVNLISINVLATVNLWFVAQYGTQQLAAAALGNNIAIMFSKLVLLGLCGALDTQASQAVGAGRLNRLPALYQRTVLFLLLHCIPITFVMLAMPRLLTFSSSSIQMAAMVEEYIILIIPGVFLEAVSRPLSRVLVAQRVAAPLMAIALMEVPINIAVNYLLVVHLDLQFRGAALSFTLASALDLLLMLIYVAGSGQCAELLSLPTKRVLTGWWNMARLSYPACFMKCAESWAFTVMTLAASLLPNTAVAVAAVGLAYNVYGILFVAFVAFSMAGSVQTGHFLGAGDATGAKASAAAAISVAPVAWLLAAVPLLHPVCQRFLITAFSDPGQGVDPLLNTCLTHLFQIVALLILFDGVQTIMSGVVQALGCQREGALVNAIAFYAFGVPSGLYLAFGMRLGAEGLYLGMMAGPVIQAACYGVMLYTADWDAVARLACLSGDSYQELGTLLQFKSHVVNGRAEFLHALTGAVSAKYSFSQQSPGSLSERQASLPVRREASLKSSARTAPESTFSPVSIGTSRFRIEESQAAIAVMTAATLDDEGACAAEFSVAALTPFAAGRADDAVSDPSTCHEQSPFSLFSQWPGSFVRNLECLMEEDRERTQGGRSRYTSMAGAASRQTRSDLSFYAAASGVIAGRISLAAYGSVGLGLDEDDDLGCMDD